MKQKQDEVPSLFQCPIIADPLDAKTRLSPIEFRQSFVNNLAMPVVLCWRNGMKFELQPEPNAINNSLIIRIVMSVKPAGYQSVMKFLSTIDEQATPELQAIRDAFYRKSQSNNYRGGEIVLDYPVTSKVLKEMGGSVYYSEIDTVVSLLPMDSWVCHPYSEEGRRLNILAGSPTPEKEGSFGYSVTMIDNAEQYGLRYININREVYKVKPSKDVRKQDGIYIVSNHSMSNRTGDGGFETRYFPFDASPDSIGLWRTYEEALHAGDLSAASKKELADMELSVKKLTLERQEAEQRHQLELVEKDRVAKLQAEAHARETLRLEQERSEFEFREKARREALKDHFEERSHVRKDHTEGLKFIPTLVVGLGALAALFLKGSFS